MSVTQNINSIDYKELYTQYNWFANSYSPIVQSCCDEFFLPGFKFVLLGISKNINTLMDKDSYFVTKIRIDNLHDMFFRMPEKTVGLILDRVLGNPNSKFNLNKLTDLEAKIITAFNDYMFNATSKFLITPQPALKRNNFDVVHLTFLIKNVDTNEVSKFIITLPDELLNPDVVASQSEKFKPGDFESSVVDITVKVGSTRLKLIDIKNIEVEDIVVLDNSDTKSMILRFNDYEKDIKLNPNLGLVVPFDNDGGNEEMADNTNLWDSIEVDMTAQFDTVRITLGELKNIEDGLVVDLTSIYDNKITLSVEDKPIARGELVIVNDRYGVKIDEIIAISPKEINVGEQPVEEQGEFSSENEIDENIEEQADDGNQEVDEEDEFDYSDFELEDEDI